MKEKTLQVAAVLLLRDKFRNRATSGQPALWASMAEVPMRGRRAKAGRAPDPVGRRNYRNGRIHAPAGIIRQLYLKSTALEAALRSPCGQEELLEIKAGEELAEQWEHFRNEFAAEAGRLLPWEEGEPDAPPADRWALRLFREQERRPFALGWKASGDGFFTAWADVYAGSALLCEKIANEAATPSAETSGQRFRKSVRQMVSAARERVARQEMRERPEKAKARSVAPPAESKPRIYVEGVAVVLDGKAIPFTGKTREVRERTADYVRELIEANGEPVKQPTNYKSHQMPQELDAVFVCDGQFQGYRLAAEFRRK